QGLKPLAPTEPPDLIIRKSKPAPALPAAGPYLNTNKVPDLQKIFQRPDGLPVYLKLGYSDKMLYRTTMALTIGGTIYCVVALIIASQPKKQ
ncbi:COX7R oxidase, partial [Prunella himalayana]|nr:COX7R oxidase [Prunella himalayana]